MKNDANVSALADAIAVIANGMPNVRKAFREAIDGYIQHESRFNEQMKKAGGDIARGCRRTKGDIV